MIISRSIAIAGMGKARPRVSRGHAYLPEAYRTWKQYVCLLLNNAAPTCALPLTGTLRLDVVFVTKTGNSRSDLDNAYAGFADCLQDARWIENDRQIKAGAFRIIKGPSPEIRFNLEELPEHAPTDRIHRRPRALVRKT